MTPKTRLVLRLGAGAVGAVAFMEVFTRLIPGPRVEHPVAFHFPLTDHDRRQLETIRDIRIRRLVLELDRHFQAGEPLVLSLLVARRRLSFILREDLEPRRRDQALQQLFKSVVARLFGNTEVEVTLQRPPKSS